MLELLRNIEKRPDSGKTIIFSEFVKMLDIVAGVLKEEGMRFVRCRLILECGHAMLTIVHQMTGQ